MQPDLLLREAGEDDCRRLWEWRNEDSARLASRNTDIIPYENHRGWFSKKLRDPNTRIFVGTDLSGTPVGYVRFDVSGDEAEISVAVDRNLRGKAYGTQMIRRGSHRVSGLAAVRRIVATVKSGNAESIKAFERAGFRADPDSALGPIRSMTYIPDPVRILFRVDAGTAIGLGHLRRCLALAAALETKDLIPLFLTNTEPGIVDLVERSGFRWSAIDSPAWDQKDAEETEAFAKRNKCRLIVADSDRKKPDYLDHLRKNALTVSIEDNETAPLACHLLINGNAHAEQMNYRSANGDTEFLLGPHYSLLPAVYWNPSRKEPADQVRSLLVSVGGADPRNLTPRLLDRIRDIPGSFSVTVVVGPFFTNRPDIERSARDLGRPCRLVDAPPDLRTVILEADLAVTAGGQTLYELACCGCPGIVLKTAENQRAQIRRFTEEGAVRSAGPADQPATTERLAEEIRNLLQDRSLRTAMSRAGRGLVDGLGALRSAEKMVALAEGVG